MDVSRARPPQRLARARKKCISPCAWTSGRHNLCRGRACPRKNPTSPLKHARSPQRAVFGWTYPGCPCHLTRERQKGRDLRCLVGVLQKLIDADCLHTCAGVDYLRSRCCRRCRSCKGDSDDDVDDADNVGCNDVMM